MTKATTAIAFAERGWHILPVAPYQKTPFFPIATHGSYADVAWLSQTMKNTLRSHSNWAFLGAPMAQSLDLQCDKMARIVAGLATEKDHWIDIQGYAQLALREIEKGEGNDE